MSRAKMSFLVFFISVLAVMLALAVSPVMVLGGEHCHATVGDGESIQAAIDAATDGAIICVAEGTYEEHVVVGTAEVRIEGPQAGLDPRSGDDRGAEAVVGTASGAFTLAADNIVLDGFELTGVTAGPAAVVTSLDHSGYEIVNNYIHGNDLGVQFRSGGAFTSVVRHNFFESNDVANDGVAKAINTGFGASPRHLRTAVIEGNRFVGHNDGDDSYSIQLVNGGEHSDVVIRDNEMESTIVLNNVDGVVVDGNDVNMEHDGESTSALFIGGAVENAVLSDNTLRNAKRGLGVFTIFGGENGTIEAVNNVFENNAVQVHDDDDDLELADVLENNTFDRAVVVRNNPIVVPTIFSNIQDAIDAAGDGDAVDVRPGIYSVDSSITGFKDGLTLQGDGSDSVTIQHTGTGRGINVAGVADITLEGFTLDGPADGVFGIKVEFVNNVDVNDVVIQGAGSTGLDFNTVDGATLTNVHANDNAGAGIALRNMSVVAVTGGGASGNAWGGLALWAPTGETLEDVTITGGDYSHNDAGASVFVQHDGTFANIALTGTTMTGNAVGFFIEDRDAFGTPDAAAFTLLSNSITGNTVDVVNEGSGTLNAVKNWWGSSQGPAEEQIEGDVDSFPWCLSADCDAEIAFTFAGLDAHEAGDVVTYEVTVRILATSEIAGEDKVRYRAEAKINGAPLAGQEVLDEEVEPFDSAFTTDAEGVAWFGPASGFPVNMIPALTAPGGHSTEFRTTFAQAGDYELSVQLYDVTDGPEETSKPLGEETTVAFTIAAPPPPPDPDPEPELPPVVPRVTVPVTPDVPAEVEIEDGRTRVEVPANAAENASTVTVGSVPDEEAPEPAAGMFRIAGHITQVTVEDDEGQPIREFTARLRLSFRVTAEELPEGTTVDDLRVFNWNEVLEAWVLVPAVYDAETGAIVASVNHLSVFSVMAAPDLVIPPDVADHWAEDDILRMLSLGAITGFEDGTFQPDETVTRAEFTALLVRSLNLDVPEAPVLDFSDAVPAWAAGYAAAAVEGGLVTGYEDGTFRPSAAISRQELAVMVVRAMGDAEATELDFTDAEDIAAWARDAAAAAAASGIITGFEDGTFRATETGSRAEAAAMLWRLAILLAAMQR